MIDNGSGGVYDRQAITYARARPDYPDQVFTTIAQYANLDTGAHVLEVGSGAGQATATMAARGWRIDAVEPGEQLIEQAKRRCAGRSVSFHAGRFEDVAFDQGVFNLIAAGTSWHWIDPAKSYQRAWELLRPGGTIALFWNAHVPDTDLPQWEPVRTTYLDVAPQLADLAPLTPDRYDYDPADELSSSDLFIDIEEHRFGFQVSYTADEFVALIGTYASHEVLDSPTRSRLHARLRETIDAELGGIVTKPYEALLVIGAARRATR